MNRTLWIGLAVVVAGCGTSSSSPPAGGRAPAVTGQPSPPSAATPVSDAGVPPGPTGASAGLYDPELARVHKLSYKKDKSLLADAIKALPSSKLRHAFDQVNTCEFALLLVAELIRRNEWPADWLPEGHWSTMRMTHSLCIVSNDTRVERRLAVLRSVVPAEGRIRVREASCKDGEQVAKATIEKNFELTGSDVDLRKLDALLGGTQGAANSACADDGACYLLPMPVQVTLLWSAPPRKLLAIDVDPSKVFPCWEDDDEISD